jgi:hypothetical protein
MPAASSSVRPTTMQLVLFPSIITLAITILRLFGELQHWAALWFSTTAGGGLAIIGISWLLLIFLDPTLRSNWHEREKGPQTPVSPSHFQWWVCSCLLQVGTCPSPHLP